MLKPELVGTVTISNGGHVTIPTEALEQLGLTDGDALLVFVGGLKKRIILSKEDNLEETIDHAIEQLRIMKSEYDGQAS